MTITPFAPHQSYAGMANLIRVLSMEAVERANSGHPGMPMGMADVATVLFRDFLKFNPHAPEWMDRDRFVLSAGHGSMLLYSLLFLNAYPNMSLSDIQDFRKLGSKTPGHPEHGHTCGIETTTGPLGQGFANALGMAIAEEKLRAEFGAALVNHKTYVIVGDGCLMEGIAQEALSLAGHLHLSNLIVLFDDNQITIDGPTSLSTRDDMPARFEASGWATLSIDGHDYGQIYEALARAQMATQPTLICCKTQIAYGSPAKAGLSSAHGSPLGPDEIAATKAALGWPYGSFDIPEEIGAAWAKAWERNKEAYQTWQGTFEAAPDAFKERMAGNLSAGYAQAAAALAATWDASPPTQATRQSSQSVLEALQPVLPELFGGSADLTPSNNTKTKGMLAFSATHRTGQYLHYGIREHAMAAAMNGIYLHGGLRPYGGTFLAFSDYCRPSIRLAALMKIPVIFVMTHDSIGLGEDGPTHQPVEHLAALRAIPHLDVFRPADAMETLGCWQMALESTDSPAVLALSRQALPPLWTNSEETLEKVRHGGYVLSEATMGPRSVTLMATGSEVHLACQAKESLEKVGIPTAVVSIPCLEVFDRTSASYQATVLGSGLRVAIEAGVHMGWDRYIGLHGLFIGMESFGASAPAEALFKHFGITVENIVNRVCERLNINVTGEF